ncbi:MAG: leucyl aminopeptidase [Candidatus Neomarinimicrobiota bacterium]|nr:leucyl aminopeptidase [Candidatus Neomarinimicrobiota bacterium]
MINLNKINTTKRPLLDLESDLLLMGFFEGANFNLIQKKLNVDNGNQLKNAFEADAFKGEKETSMTVYGNTGFKKIHVVGLGEKKDFSLDNMRSIASNLMRFINEKKIQNVIIDSDSFGLGKNTFAQSCCEGLVLGSYVFDDYKTDKNKDVKLVDIIFSGKIDSNALKTGQVLGEAVCFSRDLGNHPANILTPTYLAKAAKQIADGNPKMECNIFDGKELKKMGMGAFYGVAQGAKEPAKMIVVKYDGGNKSQKPIALVGKGLTFDSGGISIKPSPKMDEMKFDMCGSATVMGVLKAVSILKPRINIIFAIGSTENMPGSNAQRPGDIVKAYNGKTIEVLNTDAEGRLVLADVLSYVNKQYSPSAIIDFATLTGAVLIALGNRASGVMGNDVALMKEIKKASEITSEKVWELPLWEEYTREIKGKYADIQNIGQGRLAGTITAGAFLKEFVDDTPWVHMDIAGTAWGPKEPAYQPKVGATGVAVRLVYQFLLNR